MVFVDLICELRSRGVDLNSAPADDDFDLVQVFMETWSSILESSQLTMRKPLHPINWQYLMKFLADADVSPIRHLELVLPLWERLEQSNDRLMMLSLEEMPSLGSIVGRFSELHTLKIDSSAPNERDLGLQKEEPSLIEALKGGKFKSLRNLSLSTCNVAVLLKTLVDGGISQLSSCDVTIVRESRCNPIEWDTSLNEDQLLEVSRRLEAVLTGGFFKNLRHLKLTNAIIDNNGSWKVFSEAMKHGLLSKLDSFHFREIHLEMIDLGDMVPLLCFNSLENLTMDSCGITSRQVCSIKDAIMKARCNCNMIQLPLKRLNFRDNALDNDAVRAVADLADSDRLPHLQELDFSMNKGRNSTLDSTALMGLTKVIGRGRLPSLQRLNWEENPVCDAAVEVMAQAYQDNDVLTARFDIDWSQVRDPSLRMQVNEYRKRNLRIAEAKAELKQTLGDVEPLTTAKVFFCGYPQVGKTTLRKTFHKKTSTVPLKQQLKRVYQRNSHLFKNPRAHTRGIELSRVEEKQDDGRALTLVLWDLAGQEEFHVLHGSFFADLDFAGGKATTFLVVFRALDVKEVGTEKKLLYWLRFIASSSQKNVRRHVVIVLNCFNGGQCTESDKLLWVNLIASFKEMFWDLLHILKDPFIVDVRDSLSVKSLKDHLFHQARMLLRNVVVPRVCSKLQEELKLWSDRKKSSDKRSHIPIFSWQAFEGNLRDKGNNLTGKALKAAASILHEMGEIIYFDDKELAECGGSKDRSVVVAEPEWFCKEVVGELLLPKGMRNAGEASVTASNGGSISISLFQSFFQNLLVEGTGCEDVISMLERLGICYRKGKDEIIVPALIRRDDYSSIYWEGEGLYWVMGRSLVTKDEETSAIPGALFRRLQVVLAQDRKFGGRDDSNYRAGKTFSSFKVGGLLVLIQFDVDPSVPTDNRIDILVKSMIERDDSTDVSLLQVNCICEILEKLKVLCVGCCPGLKYDIKVMKYWKAFSETPKMVKRELLTLQEIKDRLINGEKYTSWHGNGHPMELKTFLSDSELNELLLSTEGDHVIRQHLHGEVKQELQQTRQKHELIRQSTAQHSFSIEDEQTSVPRFMFLSPKHGRWMRVGALQDALVLHLLCEAHYCDGIVHEVEGQEGFELPRDKLEKILPWLKWSLKTVLMLAKIVGDIHLPGMASMIPNYESKDKGALEKAVDKAAAMILEEGHKNKTQRLVPKVYGSVAEPIDVKERQIAAGVIHDLRTHYGQAVFAEKIGLRKVVLRASGQPHVGTSRRAEASVKWICEDCYRKYGDQAKAIGP